MHQHSGTLLLALLLIGIPLLTLVRFARRSRSPQDRSVPSGKRGWMGEWLHHRRTLRLENVRHENAAARAEARHRHRLREQEARERARAEAGPPPAGAPGRADAPAEPAAGRWHATVIHIWPRRWHPAGEEAYQGAPEPEAIGPAHRAGDDGSPSWRPWRRSPELPPREEDGHPAVPRPAAADQVPTLEGEIVTTPDSAAIAIPGAEAAVDALNMLSAYARSGNIKAKRRAMLALVAVCRRAARMALSLSRALAEPGQHYGPEVTERIAMGAAHLDAASFAFAEADAALATLLGSTLAETMAAGRQVPHHDEFAETGAR